MIIFTKALLDYIRRKKNKSEPMYRLNMSEMIPYFEYRKKRLKSEMESPIMDVDLYRNILQEEVRLMWEAINNYALNLKKYDNRSQLYLQDVEYAIQHENLDLIGILIHARTVLQDLEAQNIDFPILNFLTDYFKKDLNKSQEASAKYLYESILDTAEYDFDEYIDLIQRLSKLDKPSSWYADFGNQIVKLVSRAPDNDNFLPVLNALREQLPDELKIRIDEMMEHGSK
ncbi:hypothetical protein DXN04_33530 [Chitinophaga silvisoli]|uniref:Uncharacterized protein n=2 Tax=Chitinophaga silvisoli TaxID=2291814 RepID=A0A3E1NMW0_9BACT|nr:hypothetical protein DXN04_33530 [Chitinophaga silvisoli]